MHPLAAKNYTINLDKLELMLIQNDINDSTVFDSANIAQFSNLTPSTALASYSAAGVTLDKIKCDDRNYHLAYDIVINKQSFGNLLMNRTKFYESDSDLVKLKVSNAILYTDFSPLLDKLLAAFQFTVNNITRLEIALDTNTDLLSNFYYYYRNEGSYFLKGGAKKLDSINKFAKEYRNGSETPTLYLGKTDKLLRIYNKSLEISERNHKEYITEFHKANGLDTDTDVYRIEIALANTALKRYVAQYRNDQKPDEVLSQYQYDKICYNNGKQNFTYTKETVKSELVINPSDFTNTTALASIFKTVLASLCQFKHADNDNVTRCTDVELIDFSNIIKAIYNPTVTASKKRDKNRMKNYIKATIRNYQKHQLQSLLTAAYEIAKSEGLTDYYDQQIKEYNIKPVSMAANSSNKHLGAFESYLD
jgi:hypothetical protein